MKLDLFLAYYIHIISPRYPGSWIGKAKVGTASKRLEMWGYFAREGSQAFPAQVYAIGQGSKEASSQKVTVNFRNLTSIIL